MKARHYNDTHANALAYAHAPDHHDAAESVSGDV